MVAPSVGHKWHLPWLNCQRQTATIKLSCSACVRKLRVTVGELQDLLRGLILPFFSIHRSEKEPVSRKQLSGLLWGSVSIAIKKRRPSSQLSVSSSSGLVTSRIYDCSQFTWNSNSHLHSHTCECTDTLMPPRILLPCHFNWFWGTDLVLETSHIQARRKHN